MKTNNDNIDTKVIETLLFIDSRNDSTRRYVDSRILALYELSETAKELLNKDILRLTVVGSMKGLENRAFYLSASGTKLMNEYLIAQGYMSKPKISKELAHYQF
jgi:hypothetical protein